MAEELTSWKEIAAALGVSVRTAQVWERDRGLPVRRLPGPRGRVAVSIDELEAWKGTSTPAPPQSRPLLSRRALVLAGTVVLVLAGSGVMLHPGGVPSRFRIDENLLIIADQDGRELWRKAFPTRFDPGAAPNFLGGRSCVQFDDIDGDGRQEVLVAYSPTPRDTANHELVCFSATGRERWRFTPGRTVRTRSETFTPPFQIQSFATLSVGGKRCVVLSAAHSLYYPAQVALISSEGHLVREYWHSGQLPFLAVRDGLVYLGGTSNARRTGTLVALDPARFEGAAAEQEHPDYQLLGFHPGIERARIIFPRLCLTPAGSATVVQNVIAGLESLIVVTDVPHHPPAAVYYHFDPHLMLQKVVPDDGFVLAHAEDYRLGLVDHEYTAADVTGLSALTYLAGKPDASVPPPQAR
jgi:hypothetical protein